MLNITGEVTPENWPSFPQTSKVTWFRM